MVGRPLRRARLKAMADEQDRLRRSNGATGLPLQPLAEGAIGGDTDVRAHGGDHASSAPVRNDDGHGTTGEEWDDSEWADDGDRGGLRASDNGNGRHSKPSQEVLLPGDGKAQSSIVAVLEAGHRDALETGIAPDPTARVRVEDDILITQEQFDKLAELCFKRAKDILEIVPNPKQKHYTQLLTRQTTLFANIIAAMARIDEARLRRVQTSRIDRVLAEIRALRAKG